MSFLKEQVRKQVQDELKNMSGKVKLVEFTQLIECPTCAYNTALMKETAELSDLIQLEKYNFLIDKEKAAVHGIDKIPAVVVTGEKDYGVRFYGVPAGYEFTSLIEAIKNVSTGHPQLKEDTLTELSRLDRPVHIQVFVTPT